MAEIIPYIQSCLRGVKGIIPIDIYQDEDIIIPFIAGCNVTEVRQQIKERLKKTWLKNYIKELKLCSGGYFLIKINDKEDNNMDINNLENAINEALEIPVVKDGNLKMPVDELVVRNYDERHRYGTDWVTEYNYVSEKSLTPEEFEAKIKEAGQEPVGEIYPLKKKKLTFGNGKIYYRHILKTATY